jgi:hypothetical protein
MEFQLVKIHQLLHLIIPQARLILGFHLFLPPQELESLPLKLVLEFLLQVLQSLPLVLESPLPLVLELLPQQILEFILQ